MKANLQRAHEELQDVLDGAEPPTTDDDIVALGLIFDAKYIIEKALKVLAHEDAKP